jgi:hypothetical protein
VAAVARQPTADTSSDWQRSDGLKTVHGPDRAQPLDNHQLAGPASHSRRVGRVGQQHAASRSTVRFRASHASRRSGAVTGLHPARQTLRGRFASAV